MLIRDRVIRRRKTERISLGQTRWLGRGSAWRRLSSYWSGSFHITIVSLFANIGGLDHAVAINLKQVNDAADKVEFGAEKSDAGPFVRASDHNLAELYLTGLRVKIERSHAHVRLQLYEAVTVGVASYIQAIQISIVHNVIAKKTGANRIY